MNEYYHVDNFMNHVRIKENAPEILRKELKKLGFSSQRELETETLWSFLPDDDAKRLAMQKPRRIVIGVCGGVSDGFQPAEKEHKITQQILETLLDFRLPAMILTKSDLVLRDIDITIYSGEYIAIMGPSGSGKSTLLNMIGCLDRPTGGTYMLGDMDVSQLDDDELSAIRGARIGFVFQSFNLIAQLNVI
ncbi:MAG: ATP-binding cassette domain-containing protein, partial [Candidatus Sifarchaeia archaeon]